MNEDFYVIDDQAFLKSKYRLVIQENRMNHMKHYTNDPHGLRIDGIFYDIYDMMMCHGWKIMIQNRSKYNKDCNRYKVQLKRKSQTITFIVDLDYSINMYNTDSVLEMLCDKGIIKKHSKKQTSIAKKYVAAEDGSEVVNKSTLHKSVIIKSLDRFTDEELLTELETRADKEIKELNQKLRNKKIIEDMKKVNNVVDITDYFVYYEQNLKQRNQN